MDKKYFSMRIKKELMDKLKYIAKYENRSINSQIMVLIRNSVEEFEKEYGEIGE